MLELTNRAFELKKAVENQEELTEEQEELASCAGSDGFWYALMEGGYINPEDWLTGDSLVEVKKSIEKLREFEEFFHKVATEF